MLTAAAKMHLAIVRVATVLVLHAVATQQLPERRSWRDDGFQEMLMQVLAESYEGTVHASLLVV
jgi:hypothetical protein